MIERRIGGSSLGFGAEVKSKQSMKAETLIKEATHQDLVKYGLIPELVGRLPVVTTLDSMDVDSLVRIMQEPKNSVIKQYKALFKMDDVELEFEPEALRAIAQKTIERKTGARGLRSIIEGVLQRLMFDVPSNYLVEKITITADTVLKGEPPVLLENPARKPKALSMPVEQSHKNEIA